MAFVTNALSQHRTKIALCQHRAFALMACSPAQLTSIKHPFNKIRAWAIPCNGFVSQHFQGKVTPPKLKRLKIIRQIQFLCYWLRWSVVAIVGVDHLLCLEEI